MKWYEANEVQVGDILAVTTAINKGRLVKVVEKTESNYYFIVKTADGLPFKIPHTMKHRYFEDDNTKAVIPYQRLDTRKIDEKYVLKKQISVQDVKSILQEEFSITEKEADLIVNRWLEAHKRRV